ncbi:MAG: UDP-4-amino-4,6-dideoxy-N-acetyl-beta-L-altrosamine transaminase [Atribacterota bacterium]
MNKDYIPYSCQDVDERDIKEVSKVLSSDFLTQGPRVNKFEEMLADYCGTKYCVALSSGTAALHGAYFAAGINQEDEVISSPITFAATTNAALFLGARPVFVDIKSDTGNIDANLIEDKINKNTKAIVPVHYSGQPAGMQKIKNISQKHNITVIEDACHALGAEYNGKKIGSCEYSDMAVFSFHPVKPITTGEGGAILTNNKEYYDKIKMFRQHGITKDKNRMKRQKEGGWYHEMQFLGYNYRITDIQCALGVSQLNKLDKFIDKRRKSIRIYRDILSSNKNIELPYKKKDVRSSWHLYPIKIKNISKEKKRKIFSELRKRGVGVQVHYIPVYWHPYYQEMGYKKGLCPKAEKFYKEELSIPLHQKMDEDDVKRVCSELKKLVEK